MYFGYVSSFFYPIPLPSRKVSSPNNLPVWGMWLSVPQPIYLPVGPPLPMGDLISLFPTLEGLLKAQACASVNPAVILWMQQPYCV